MSVKKGDFITVTEWVDSVDKSYIGDCLEVTSVDKNLVRVLRHDGILKDYRTTLNLDCVNTRQLSDDFVKTILSETDKDKAESQDEAE